MNVSVKKLTIFFLILLGLAGACINTVRAYSSANYKLNSFEFTSGNESEISSTNFDVSVFLKDITSALFFLNGSGSGSTPPFSIPEAPNCTDTKPGSVAPVLYSAVPTSSTSILLSFTPNSDPVDHYVLTYGKISGQYTHGSTNIGDKNIRSYEVKALSPNTKYYFRVLAANGCAVGTWSNEISATTRRQFLFGNLPIVSTTFDTDPQTASTSESEGRKKELKYTLNVKVIDSLSNPVGDAEVKLKSELGLENRQKTDSEGLAVFKDLEAGLYTLEIEVDGKISQQSITISGPNRIINLTVQVDKIEAEKDLLKIVLLSSLIGLALIILLVLIYLKRRKKKLYKSDHHAV